MIRKATTSKLGQPKTATKTTSRAQAKRKHIKVAKKPPHRIAEQDALTYMAKVNANFHQTGAAQTYRCPENHICVTPFCITCNIRAAAEAKRAKLA